MKEDLQLSWAYSLVAALVMVTLFLAFRSQVEERPAKTFAPVPRERTNPPSKLDDETTKRRMLRLMDTILESQHTAPVTEQSRTPAMVVYDSPALTPYGNLDGESNVTFYALGDDFIDVKFKDGMIYRYSNKSAPTHLDALKVLAQRGHGLNAYINQNVRLGYELKWREQ